LIASLGMYDFGDLQPANDRFWALIRDGLRRSSHAAPDSLTRGYAAYWPAWESPDLILSQTCGYPYRARLHDHVTYVATPDFGVEGCPPGYYYSQFIARADDPRQTIDDFDGAAFAFNEGLSQSGWAGPQTYALSRGLKLPPTLPTGGHRLSALAVAEGRADIAAIDAVTWRIMQRNDPATTSRLRPVAQTDPTPGLPYIAAKGTDAAAVLSAIQAALAALSNDDRATLGLRALISIPAQDYLSVPNPPPPAQSGLCV
jgi:ABC-type phosphate/phosphonate transport system substrate-binding protein